MSIEPRVRNSALAMSCEKYLKDCSPMCSDENAAFGKDLRNAMVLVPFLSMLRALGPPRGRRTPWMWAGRPHGAR